MGSHHFPATKCLGIPHFCTKHDKAMRTFTLITLAEGLGSASWSSTIDLVDLVAAQSLDSPKSSTLELFPHPLVLVGQQGLPLPFFIITISIYSYIYIYHYIYISYIYIHTYMGSV